MKFGQVLSGAVVCCLAAGGPAFADVQVSMQNGRVSVVAKDATLRQIFVEWARVGQTKVVNVERIPGGPMTIELRDIPEAQALEILLRSLSGYMAAPRPGPAANLSRFDRIVVMPTVAAARQQASGGTAAPPVFQPQPMPQVPPADPTEEQEDRSAPPQVPGGGRPVFNAFPQPQIVSPNGAMPGAQPPQGGEPPVPPPPSAFPTPAPGVSVPGMIVPAPPPPPNANPNQVRRPGGPVGQ